MTSNSTWVYNLVDGPLMANTASVVDQRSKPHPPTTLKLVYDNHHLQSSMEKAPPFPRIDGLEFVENVIVDNSCSTLETVATGFLTQMTKLSHVEFGIGFKGVKTIGDSFLSFTNVRHVSLLLPSLERCGESFMAFNDQLVTVDLLQCSSLRIIGFRFLTNCRSLRTATFNDFRSVEKIGGKFAFHTSALCELDLSSLVNIEAIGDNFLNHSGAQRVILGTPTEELEALTKVGDDFLAFNNGLSDVRLAKLPALEEIGDSFISRCPSLKRVGSFTAAIKSVDACSADLSSLTSCLRTVGAHFLSHNKALERVNFGGTASLSQVESISHAFLASNDVLSVVSVAELPSLKSVGDDCMCNCPILRGVSSHFFTSLEHVGNRFMHNTGAEELHITFNNLATVGDDFFSSCRYLACGRLHFPSLQSAGNEFLSRVQHPKFFEVSGMSHLKRAGHRFMADSMFERIPFMNDVGLVEVGNSFLRNTEVHHIDDMPFPLLEKVGDQFLSCNRSLSAVNTQGLRSLRMVGNSFISCNPNLSFCVGTDLGQLVECGERFMSDNSSLSTFDFSSMRNLTKIGDRFLEGSSVAKLLIPPRDFCHLHNNPSFSAWNERNQFCRVIERKLLLHEPLGSGSFGNVLRVVDMTTEGEYALKRSTTGKSLVRERDRHLKLDCPYIVKAFLFEEVSDEAIVLELMNGGSIAQFMRDKHAREHMAMRTYRKWFKEALLGLEALADAKMLHHDISPGNILISDANVVKLTDLGLAKQLEENILTAYDQGKQGTLLYLPFEQLSYHPITKSRYTHRSDVWSLVTVFTELALSCHADEDTSHKPYLYTPTEQLPFHDLQLAELPPDLARLVSSCFVAEAKRPTASQMLQHEFFRQQDGHYLTYSQDEDVLPPVSRKKVDEIMDKSGLQGDQLTIKSDQDWD